LQDNKLNSDVEKFINDEITNSKIWVFCGIMISVLLSQMLNLQAEIYKIMYIFKMRKVLDKMSFLFIAIIILEIFLTFFLYKIIYKIKFCSLFAFNWIKFINFFFSNKSFISEKYWNFTCNIANNIVISRNNFNNF